MTSSNNTLIDETKLHPRLMEAVNIMRADGVDEMAIACALRDAKKAVKKIPGKRYMSPECRAAARERLREWSTDPSRLAKRNAAIRQHQERVKLALKLLEIQEKSKQRLAVAEVV